MWQRTRYGPWMRMWGHAHRGERGRSAKASQFGGDEVCRCLRESWLHYLLLFRLASLPLELPGSPKWGKDRLEAYSRVWGDNSVLFSQCVIKPHLR